MSRALCEDAYRKFWDRLEAGDMSSPHLLSFDICKAVLSRKWPNYSEATVEGELKESINQMNRWATYLFRLHAWADVLAGYEKVEAWKIRSHFVEAVTHFCMYQPSAARDRIGRIATNAIHQANLASIPEYRDELVGDRRRSGIHLRRGEVEPQLKQICMHWTSASDFLQVLSQLDDADYRRQSKDFRNRASHFLPQSIELGLVVSNTRERVPAITMVKQPNGYFRPEEIPGKAVISYGFGELEPVSLRSLIGINQAQHRVAIHVHECYVALLNELLETLPRQPLTDENGD